MTQQPDPHGWLVGVHRDEQRLVSIAYHDPADLPATLDDLVAAQPQELRAAYFCQLVRILAASHAATAKQAYGKDGGAAYLRERKRAFEAVAAQTRFQPPEEES